jgi:hypothetical protein
VNAPDSVILVAAETTSELGFVNRPDLWIVVCQGLLVKRPDPDKPQFLQLMETCVPSSFHLVLLRSGRSTDELLLRLFLGFWSLIISLSTSVIFILTRRGQVSIPLVK